MGIGGLAFRRATSIGGSSTLGLRRSKLAWSLGKKRLPILRRCWPGRSGRNPGLLLFGCFCCFGLLVAFQLAGLDIVVTNDGMVRIVVSAETEVILVRSEAKSGGQLCFVE